MSGRLTAILFSEKTAQTLYDDMQGSPDDAIDHMLIDMLQNLECDDIKVKGVEDDCVVVIETFLPRHATARLTLMRAEGHDVIMQACTDLNPFMETGRAYADDYDDISQCLSENNEDMNLRAQKKIQDLNRARYNSIGNIFNGFIDNDAFREHLVDALDLAISPDEKQKTEQAKDITINLLSRFTRYPF